MGNICRTFRRAVPLLFVIFILALSTYCCLVLLFSSDDQKEASSGTVVTTTVANNDVTEGSNIDQMFQSRRQAALENCQKHFGYDASMFNPQKDFNSLLTRSSVDKWPFIQFTFYDDRYKLLFCTIPKVASTNIKEMLLNFLDRHLITWPTGFKGKKWLPHIHRLIELYDPEEIKARMANYTKIIFVRHPIERVISAWRDKFLLGYSTKELRQIGEMIVNKYRRIDHSNKNLLGPTPTLSEFFEYLSKDGIVNPDVHWRSYVQTCDPCHINYDYIGHFENLTEELDYVMMNLTGRPVLRNKELQNPAKDSFAAGKRHRSLRSFYSDQVPLSSDLYQRVVDRYQADFDIFSYLT